MKSYSLKWRLVSTILMVFVILWSLVFCWLYFELEKRLQNTLDERLSASAHMVARLIYQLPVDQI
ncbi:two-component sensor histidine kinase, partial [Acinetobacter baumannii]